MDISSVNSDLIRGNVITIILGCLRNEDKYGYEILKEIEDRSHGQYALKQATLYNQLKRLEKQGLVMSYDGAPDDTGGGKRRYYALTNDGKAYLDKEKDEYEYARTILDKLVSEKEFDFTKEIPFDASELRPYSKRDSDGEKPEKEKIVYKDKIVEVEKVVEKKIYIDRFGNPLSEEELEQATTQALIEDEEARKKEEELNQLKKQLEDAENERLEQEERLRALEEERAANEEKLRELQEARDAEQQLAEDEEARRKEEELNELKQQLEDAENEKREQEEKLRALEEERAANEEKLRELQEAHDAAQQQLAESEEERAAKEEALRTLEEENNATKEQLLKTEEEKRSKEEELERLEAEHNATKEQLETVSNEYNSTEEQLRGILEEQQREAELEEQRRLEEEERERQEEERRREEQAKPSMSMEELFAKLDSISEYRQQESPAAEQPQAQPTQEAAADVYYDAEIQSTRVSGDGTSVSAAPQQNAGGFAYERNDVNYRDFFMNIASKPDEPAEQHEEAQPQQGVSATDIRSRLYAKGFKVRSYDRGNTSEYYTFNFIQSNRLNRDTSLIMLAFFLVELAIMWVSLIGNTTMTYKYFLPIMVVGTLLCLIPAVIYIMNPTKRTRANFSFKLSLLNRTMLFIELTVVCILIGFFALGASVKDTDIIIASMVLPTVWLLNLPISSIIYWLLYRTRRYHIA